MNTPLPTLVHEIRAASRILVREFGFMDKYIGGTQLSASAVHALVEIGAAGHLSAKQLSQILLLEKSTISRLVAALQRAGEIEISDSGQDARYKSLSLSAKGKQTLAAITQFAEAQVVGALTPLDDATQKQIAAGLQRYAAALRESRTGVASDHAIARSAPVAEIHTGYRPSLVGRIVELHAGYYSRLVDFGAAFESTVAEGLSEFISRCERPMNAIWWIDYNGQIAGSIAIDGEDLADGLAHLRWFIVDDACRGHGLGAQLLDRAVAFCDAGDFHEVHLWTFKGLDAARKLYEKHGFVLVEEYPGDQWGRRVQEQKFIRR